MGIPQTDTVASSPSPAQTLVPYKPKRRSPSADLGGPPTTAAPAPSGVLTVRPDLAAEAGAFAYAARSEATRKAYRADWRIFQAWCEQHGATVLPATPETFAAFLVEQARTKALATILRYAASISKAHKLAGHPSPKSNAWLGEILEGLRRTKGVRPRGAKDAFTREMAHAAGEGTQLLLAVGPEEDPGSEDELDEEADDEEDGEDDSETPSDPPDTLPSRTLIAHKILRDRAVLLTGLFTAMRRSELCGPRGLRIEDLQWVQKGVIATIRCSKTDQYGEGRLVAIPKINNVVCPVAALRSWLDLVGEGTGPLFRGFKSNGQIRKTPLWPGEVAEIVKRVAVHLGLDPKKFGGHSLRAGYVTQARLAGIDWGTIMEQTGHTRVETVKLYARGSFDPFRSSKVAEVFEAFAGVDTTATDVSE